MSSFLSFRWAGVLGTSLAFSLSLASCQPLPGGSAAPSGPSDAVNTESPANEASGTGAAQDLQTPSAEGRLIRAASGDYRLALQIRLPGSDGFGLKALRCTDIAKIRASVQGLGMTTPVYAQGADADDYTVAHDGSCLVTLNFDALPLGPVRLLKIEGLNGADQLVPGSTLKRAFAILSENEHVLRVNLGHWPLGDMLEQLLQEESAASNELASRLDLEALQTFIESITEPNQNFNNFWLQQGFATNPSHLNTAAILAALKTANGNVDALSADNADFVQQAAEISLNLQGLVAPQRDARISVSDPSSAARIVNANGATSVASITPGEWVLTIRVPGYETHTQNVTLAAGQNLNLGTITLQEKAWNVSYFAGDGTEGYEDGATALSSKFDFTGLGGSQSPFNLAMDGDDNLYIPDTGNHRIRKVTPAQQVSTLAGTGTAGIADGGDGVGTLNAPMGITFSGGNLFVTQVNAVRRVNATTGEITATLAGDASTTFFHEPLGLALNPNDTNALYIANSAQHQIKRLRLTDNNLSVAVGPAAPGWGHQNGLPGDARFSGPRDIAWSPDGKLYIADSSNHNIRRFDPDANDGDGELETFAGAPDGGWNPGYVEAVGTAARFNEPSALAFDAAGNLYVADTGNGCIRKIVPATRQVSTFAGTCQQYGDAVGNARTTARFSNPAGLVFDSQGRLYMADRNNHRVYRITPPALY